LIRAIYVEHRDFWLYKQLGRLLDSAVMSDQWFGHRADPNSSFASEAGILMFAVLGVIQLVPISLLPTLAICHDVPDLARIIPNHPLAGPGGT
jgi:hypothetical protein